MLNCPAPYNNCPSRAAGYFDLADRLSEAACKEMDGIPIPDDLYREALTKIRAVLLDGCASCVKNAVVFLAIDLKWPPNRAIQIVLLESLLDRVKPVVN